MRRTVIALSALSLLAAPAVAQETTAPTELEQSGLTPPTVLSQGYSTTGEDVLVTKLLGQKVYSAITDDAQEIGTVNDMVVTSGVGITAVVIGVGGLLGVGAKDVAVAFEQLEWAQRDDGSRRWIIDTTAEDLAAAPAFIWGDSEATTGEPALTPEEEQEQLVDGDPNAAPVDPTLTTDQAERPVISTPVDRSGFSEFDETGLAADQLRGIGVYGINDEQIGTIGDIVANTDGGFDAVVVDVGGFLGLGAKPVAVAFENLTFSSDTLGSRYLFINATREQLEAQPQYDATTYASQRDAQRMIVTP